MLNAKRNLLLAAQQGAMQAAPDAPIACTLPSADFPQRLAWIRQVMSRSLLALFVPLAPSGKDCGCAAGACG